jgi:hypothetical protein
MKIGFKIQQEAVAEKKEQEYQDDLIDMLLGRQVAPWLEDYNYSYAWAVMFGTENKRHEC